MRLGLYSWEWSLNNIDLRFSLEKSETHHHCLHQKQVQDQLEGWIVSKIHQRAQNCPLLRLDCYRNIPRRFWLIARGCYPEFKFFIRRPWWDKNLVTRYYSGLAHKGDSGARIIPWPIPPVSYRTISARLSEIPRLTSALQLVTWNVDSSWAFENANKSEFSRIFDNFAIPCFSCFKMTCVKNFAIKNVCWIDLNSRFDVRDSECHSSVA